MKEFFGRLLSRDVKSFELPNRTPGNAEGDIDTLMAPLYEYRNKIAGKIADRKGGILSQSSTAQDQSNAKEGYKMADEKLRATFSREQDPNKFSMYSESELEMIRQTLKI